MAARYSEEVELLSTALYDEGLRFEASNILRSLIDEIRMIPDPTTPAKHDIELIGDLAGILHLMNADNKRPPAKLGGSIGWRSDSLVAGAGLGLHRTAIVLIHRATRFGA
ncbi:hypothetical protein Q9295_16305 [Xinfangfangia sp. CPCC 101601]|uniref:Uncharacterized protein n=1 Tax=Pseudogemmobacter lacusdianii TaxID=3069608 RepID=A0ABU0W1Q5_9RHOB|nr:hypothetical protein [Xinfangfangia sp. CPCC 101601]MDQ2067938.1 hypothetical protein [Xinfangfangia sp. CPCC 101601]